MIRVHGGQCIMKNVSVLEIDHSLSIDEDVIYASTKYASEEMRTWWILWMLEMNRASECHCLGSVVQSAAT